jgi:uncharacterized UBP type Zn finger protein
MIENLENIKNFGLKKFITGERIRWTCSECGGKKIVSWESMNSK